MTITYAYRINGSASEGQTWETTGEVSTSGPGSFMEAVDHALRDGFATLTQGKAVYGNPGVGCVGPYCITNFWLAEKF